jgi:hypothetical protein
MYRTANLFNFCRIFTGVPVRKIFFTDPDPTFLLAIAAKHNFFKHLITDKKFSFRQVNATGDQREEIYVCNTFNFKIFNMIPILKKSRIRKFLLANSDPGSLKVTDLDPEN